MIRLVGDDHEPRQFATFAPAAIACIGKLPATSTDRSHHRSRCGGAGRMSHCRADGCRPEVFRPLGAPVRALDQWIGRDTLPVPSRSCRPSCETGQLTTGDRCLLSPTPLAATGQSGRGQRRGCCRRARRATTYSARITLLADIKDMFAAADARPANIRKHLHQAGADGKSTLARMAARKPITARQLAKLLKPFKIFPRHIRPGDGKTPKGYYLAAFAEAFARYLPV